MRLHTTYSSGNTTSKVKATDIKTDALKLKYAYGPLTFSVHNWQRYLQTLQEGFRQGNQRRNPDSNCNVNVRKVFSFYQQRISVYLCIFVFD